MLRPRTKQYFPGGPPTLFWLSVVASAAVLVPDGAQAAAASRIIAIKKEPYVFRKALLGAPSGTRTQDPLIKSQLLSQLTNTNGVIKAFHLAFLPLKTADMFLSHGW